jgi:orotidine-5'-phosphate decarboxylase
VDQLLVALDVESGLDAMNLAGQLRGVVGGFKIGSRLFTHNGPQLVRALRQERGDRIFLDLKFHDIPNTVATAVSAAVSLGVWMVNVHAAGGTRMMRAAVQAAREAAATTQQPPPLVIAVTVLTSMNDASLGETGVKGSAVEQVVRLARLAQDAGVDGVVASPREISLIRQACGDSFTIVTPGIRDADAPVAQDDQQRTMTAAEAIAAGANYIVVGRPIIAAPDPGAAAEAIVASIAHP